MVMTTMNHFSDKQSPAVIVIADVNVDVDVAIAVAIVALNGSKLLSSRYVIRDMPQWKLFGSLQKHKHNK